MRLTGLATRGNVTRQERGPRNVVRGRLNLKPFHLQLRVTVYMAVYCTGGTASTVRYPRSKYSTILSAAWVSQDPTTRNATPSASPTVYSIQVGLHEVPDHFALGGLQLRDHSRPSIKLNEEQRLQRQRQTGQDAVADRYRAPPNLDVGCECLRIEGAVGRRVGRAPLVANLALDDAALSRMCPLVSGRQPVVRNSAGWYTLQVSH